MRKTDIYNEALAYFKGDSLAANVWIDKYALKDANGELYETTPNDMHWRLAGEFARIERNYPNPIQADIIFELIKDFRYIIPQGSPMAGIGNNFTVTSLSNCFVIGNNSEADSYGSIMRVDEEQVQIMKRRGGVGHDLSHLRPSGAYANNALLTDLGGAILYAQRYSNSTKEVRQGDRRGALMLTISIEHPDAEKFIDAKIESGKITDANMSVRITDSFMKAVENDGDFYQRFPITYKFQDDLFSDQPYDILTDVTLRDGTVLYVRRIKAKKLWDKIIHNAWKSAEPGVMFWDHIKRESVADCYEDFQTSSTNPCGEIPLSPYDSCRLLAINLFAYVVHPFESNAYFDFDLFREHIIIAQRLMDDLVDLEIEKIERILTKIVSDPEDDDIKRVEEDLWCKIRDAAIKGRRTGLGITAEGDMLAALGLRYGSAESIMFSAKVHENLAVHSYISSVTMAEERGSFPDWEYIKEARHIFIERIMDSHLFPFEMMNKYTEHGRRNISNLTIAPTGTTSILTQTTSGIEPCFAVYYKRRRRTMDRSKAVFIDDQGEMFEEYMVFHHKFTEWYDKNWFKTDPHLYDIDYKKPLEDYKEEELKILISKSPYHQATANDIDWAQKVELQGAVQKWVDHSISATTNIPEHTHVGVVSDIYMTAYKSGCKGMTIYREGSRSGILVNTSNEEVFIYVDAIKRPKELECDIYHKTALKQNWTILVGKLENKPYEIFAFPEVDNHVFPLKLDKGHIIKIKSKHYKLVGKDLDKTYEIPNIIDLIDSSSQVNTRKFSLMLRHHIDPKSIITDIEEYALVSSFDKVVQRVLRNYVDSDGNDCPHCGGHLTSQDGCIKCMHCGWSKC